MGRFAFSVPPTRSFNEPRHSWAECRLVEKYELSLHYCLSQSTRLFIESFETAIGVGFELLIRLEYYYDREEFHLYEFGDVFSRVIALWYLCASVCTTVTAWGVPSPTLQVELSSAHGSPVYNLFKDIELRANSYGLVRMYGFDPTAMKMTPFQIFNAKAFAADVTANCLGDLKRLTESLAYGSFAIQMMQLLE